MTSLKMDRRFTCTYFPCTLTGNAGKWFKSLRPGSISSFEQLKYLFLNDFMQLRKGKGDANSVMACKQKDGHSIHDYYDRFMLATVNIPGIEDFLVMGAFAQGLLPRPLSKKKCKGQSPDPGTSSSSAWKKYLIQIVTPQNHERRKRSGAKDVMYASQQM